MRRSSATSWPLPRYWEQISARRSHVTTVWYSAFPWPLVAVGGDAECPHRLAVRERAHLRVARQSTRQQNPVHAVAPGPPALGRAVMRHGGRRSEPADSRRRHVALTRVRVSFA